ncbi:MAG: phenylalanine--tRNA ligase subunit beta [Oscillospiraceae bacterium]
MKMPLNWAKDFADFTCTPHEYAERMTMSGSKVECFECEADGVENVVVGKINSIVPHPDSDHMVICMVDVGQGEPVQIVTGAGNLKVGDLVPAALHVAKLPGGTVIRKGKLRGVESCGMLCSLGELGLTKHDFPNATEDGILVIDEEWPVGTPAVKALGMDDVSVEFEITPNRPDCLSVRALARETAATFGVEFKDHIPKVQSGTGDINKLLKVKVEDGELCSHYAAAMVQNVRIKPSPRWMRERLRLCGVRPINNIVDITNYVMLEYGQPMHAFDYSYVNGASITVRRARKGEEIVTLDGITRTLAEDMLVIADDKAPMAVAGVMGGEFSGIYENTDMIVFESACFDGPSVRVTAKRLGMRTEASGRFEKGLNPENCMPALNRALELVQMLDAGDVINGVLDDYPSPRKVRRVALRPQMINKLLGTELNKEEIVKYLLPLGFIIEGDDVLVPPERYDVERDCDIAEEVARYIGYNNMPSTAVRGVASARPSERQSFDEKLTNAMLGYGFYEVESFSFYSRKAFDAVNLPENDSLRNAVVISNPLGEDTSIMRTTAIPSIMDIVARNFNARAAECAVFENATEYIPYDDINELPQENQKLIVAAYGDDYDYLTMKGVVEGVLACAGIKEYTVKRDESGTMYHPGRCAVVMLGEEKVATIGEIHPKVLGNYGIKPRCVAADINKDVLFQNRAKTAVFAPLPKHPAITRDLALVASSKTEAAEIAARIKKAAGKALESLTLFDIYTGDKIGEDKKSLAYSLVLRASERTLTDDEAETAVKKVLSSLAEIDVVLRS